MRRPFQTKKRSGLHLFFQVLEHASFITTAISILFLITFFSTRIEMILIGILDMIFIWITVLKLIYGLFLMISEKQFSSAGQREMGMGIMFLLLYGWVHYLGILKHPETRNIFDQFSLILRMIIYAVYLLFNRIKIITYLKTIRLNPYQTFSLGFLALIIVGAWLLSLPWATHHPVSFLDTLFISTSSVCVTGLSPIDIGTSYTLFGQTVLLFLMQTGGLGIMTFSVFIILLSGKKIGFQDRISSLEMYSQEDFASLKKVIHTMIFSTMIIEGVGAVLIFFSFPEGPFLEKVFASIFHSVAAFCNAGFSTFSSNLMNFYGYLNINFIFSSLIIMGGIGFPVLLNLKERLISRKKITLHTKIVLITSGILLLGGFFLFFFEEYGFALKNYSLPDKILISFFQSVTARTAGFNTIDIAALQTSTYLWLIILMFIGAAPGSNGGGLKVTNFFILSSMVFFIFRRRELNKIYLFRQRIKNEVLIRVGMSFFLRVALVLTAIQIMIHYENFNLIQIVFEAVSAFSTTGLSIGITASLTPQSKIVIILLMFIGRIEPLNLLSSFSNLQKTSSVEYSEEGYLITGG